MAEKLASLITAMRRNKMMFPIYVDLPHARIFTVFFPARVKNAPVLLYNPGGPGGSGITDLFLRFAPYILSVDENEEFIIEKNSGEDDITARFNLLYMDIPAGTGFSIPKDKSIHYGDVDTVDTAIRVIKAVLKAMRGYVGDSPTLDFMGFSYAGKIWPLIAQQLYMQGYKIGGLLLFSGYTSPILQEIRPIMEYLLYEGLITSSDYTRLDAMTDKIEEMLLKDTTGKNWRQIQKLYMKTITDAWEAASTDTYDTRNPSTVEDPLDKPSLVVQRHHQRSSNISKDDTDDVQEDIFLNMPIVQQALGVSTPFHSDASTFSIDEYQGFLAPATQALKFLAEKGVFIFYIMGSLDGATLAKGTKDMLEYMFNIKLKEKRWIVPVDGTPILIGKIAQVRPNVYYATVIGSGHSMNTPEGTIAFNSAMQSLATQKVSMPQ
jgi:pimeloyl-ACP methyl ester carboxylesterase